jgi:hypothetical protein
MEMHKVQEKRKVAEEGRIDPRLWSIILAGGKGSG